MSSVGSEEFWSLSVDVHSRGEVSREANPDDEWDADDISFDSWVEGIRLCDGVGDVILDFEPKAGETLWLLHAIYSTGDSFHHETGLLAPLAAFRSPDKANRAAEELERCAHEFGAAIIGESGRILRVDAVWSGYFENAQSFGVGAFRVQPKA